MSETTGPTPTRETRARRRIRKAVESRGFTLIELRWKPWYDAGEKAGIGGGWYGIVDRPTDPTIWPGNEVMGLSVEEAVAWVDEFFPTPKPCECPKPERPALMSNEPASRHLPGCRWHLRYWLPWWGEKPSSAGSSRSLDVEGR